MPDIANTNSTVTKNILMWVKKLKCKKKKLNSHRQDLNLLYQVAIHPYYSQIQRKFKSNQ